MVTSFIAHAIEVDQFKRINARDGLSHNSVLCMLNDSKGFMWFGTWNGLNRYDGYKFKTFRSLPGQKRLLSHNRITSLHEDPYGYIWVKSYDGYYHIFDPRTESFVTPDTTSTKVTGFIEHFFQLNKNEIWLGSNNNGIYRFVYDSIEAKFSVSNFNSGNSSLSNNSITCLYADNKFIWIGTQKGVNRVSIDKLKDNNLEFHASYHKALITNIISSSGTTWIGTKYGLVYFDHSKQRYFRAALPLIRINTLASAGKDNLLVGTDKLLCYNTRSHKAYDIPHKGSYITGIYPDKKGAFWITSATTGVNRVDSFLQKADYYELTPQSIINQVEKERHVFFEDSNDNLWIGVHGGGLSLFDEKTKTLKHFRNDPQDQASISSNFVHCISEDKFGTIWVGTGQPFGSINKIITRHPGVKNIVQVPDSKNNSENVVRGLLQDSNGNIWVSTKNGLVYIYDKNMNVIHRFPFAPQSPNESGFNVYTMYQDSKGYIWLGAKNRGVGVTNVPLSSGNNAYRNLKFNYLRQGEDKNSLIHNDIYSITEDHLGRIWIGTFSRGIDIIEHPSTPKAGTFTHLNSSTTNLQNNNIRFIYRDKLNTMWIATSLGLYEINAEHIEQNRFEFKGYFRTSRNEAISYNDIVHICEDSQGRLWFATLGGGLNLLNNTLQTPRNFIYFSQQDGLSNDEVHSIVEDNYGTLWIATENGLNPFNAETQTFKQYGVLNRLANTSFSESTAVKLKDGSLLLGTAQGLEIIQPKLFTKKQPVSKITFTTLLVSNKEVRAKDENTPLKNAMPFTKDVTLNHNQSSFSVEFSALNFQDKELIQYAYHLNGFEEEWTSVGNNNVATYTNIPPGHYQLEVRANSDYILPAIMDITILSPWYQTQLAYFAYAFLILIIAYLIFIYARRINLYKNNLKVEKRVNELKLRFFTNISHEIRTPLTLIMGPLEDLKNSNELPEDATRTLNTMMRNGKRMLRLINQLLDFRKVQNEKMQLQVKQTDIVNILKDNFSNFEAMAQRKKLQFTMEIDETIEPLFIDIPKIDSVLFNLLSNAFKFTPEGGSISIILKNDKESISILVSDTGKGIKAERIPHLFKRYETLSDETGQGGGTGIGLNLAYELVKLHEGDIEIDSVIGEGSTFKVILKKGEAHLQNKPFVNFLSDTISEQEHKPLSDQISPERGIEYSTDQQSKEKNKSVLIVEDNEDISEYLVSLLEKEYNILLAQNGQEGLEKAKNDNPDLIVSDVMMPIMDGVEMTSKIKADFDICHIPVIMLTAKTTTNDKIKGVEAGAEVYVTKPFSGAYLKSVVQNLLKQRQLIMHRLQDKSEIGPQDLNISEKDETFLSDLIRYIEANYQNNKLSVEELSEALCVSRTVFYNKVKSLTGLSPIEFIRQMKLKIAAQLLSKGYNVSEVALLIGYNDIKYFSRKFKEQFGYPPSKHNKMVVE